MRAGGAISLPMYDFAPLAAAHDALARALAAALPPGLAAEARFVTDRPAEAWRAADLLLSQTCGYPLMTAFREDLAYLATPLYDLPGCAGPRYCSMIVVRADDPAGDLAAQRGRRVAFNSRDSQSGYNCLRLAVAPLAGGKPFFAERLETGAHAASLAAVAEGRADVAAIDCVSHGLWARHEPGRLAGTRVLARSASAPALPYVTRADAGAERIALLRSALQRVAGDPDLAWARQALALSGFTVLPEGAYEKIPEMERAARALGYPDLV